MDDVLAPESVCEDPVTKEELDSGSTHQEVFEDSIALQMERRVAAWRVEVNSLTHPSRRWRLAAYHEQERLPTVFEQRSIEQERLDPWGRAFGAWTDMANAESDEVQPEGEQLEHPLGH